MDTIGLLGQALGLGLASGISLYGTVFVTGLAIRLAWVRLGPPWDGLAVLADPVVLTVAGLLCAIELLADKIPWVDSVWDALHTVIRPVGGALLATRVLGDLHPAAEVLAFLLLGGAALATHSAKAGVRLAANASPEPLSNWVLSTTENVLVLGVVWLVFAHPWLALGVGLVLLATAIWLGVTLLRAAVRGLGRLRVGSRAGGPH